MSGGDGEDSVPGRWSDHEDRQGEDFYTIENEKESVELATERAHVFAQRALQEHHLKMEGTTEFLISDGDVFGTGTVAMAMGTKALREVEYQASTSFVTAG